MRIIKHDIMEVANVLDDFKVTGVFSDLGGNY